MGFRTTILNENGDVFLEGSVSPVDPGDAITPVATTTPALDSYGFTEAQAEAIIANLNTVTALLAANGFVA